MKTYSALGFPVAHVSAQVATNLAHNGEPIEWPISGDKTAMQRGGRFARSHDCS